MEVYGKAKYIVAFLIIQMGCSTVSKTKIEGPRLHNIAPAFVDYWKGVESKNIDVQLSELKRTLFPKFPEFYEYKIEKWKKQGKNPDKELKKQLREFPKIKNEFIKKTKIITKNLERTIKTFEAAVPGLDKDFDVYITHSFGDMDGGTRKIGDKVYFILGVDGMVKYHKGFSSEVPFFHHELFHMYHNQFLSKEESLWVALWAELLMLLRS